MNSLYDELLTKLSSSWQGLSDKPEENPGNTLRALWLFAAGKPRAVQHTENVTLPPLVEQSKMLLKQLIDQRISGIPLAYLIRRQSFMGIEMLAGPEAMIARKETEIVGSAALAILKTVVQERGVAKVIDLCTGSGNLALALAFYEKNCQVIGADISEEALGLARRNAEYLGLADRVEFRQSDLFSSFEDSEFFEQFDLVVCNPPYISSTRITQMPPEISDFEPRLAFDGGPFGVNIMARLIQDAPRFLKLDSWLGFEVGLGQGGAMHRKLAMMASYSQIQEYKDNQGFTRALLAQTGSNR